MQWTAMGALVLSHLLSSERHGRVAAVPRGIAQACVGTTNVETPECLLDVQQNGESFSSFPG